MIETVAFFNLIDTNEDAKRLFDDLLSNYNLQVRPVEKTGDLIKLHLGIRLSQIADIVSIFSIKTINFIFMISGFFFTVI